MHLVEQSGQAVGNGKFLGLGQQFFEQCFIGVQVFRKVTGDKISENEHDVEGQHGHDLLTGEKIFTVLQQGDDQEHDNDRQGVTEGFVIIS